MAKQYKDRFVVTVNGQRKTIRNKSLFSSTGTRSQQRLIRSITNLLEELEIAKEYDLPPTRDVLEEVRGISWLNEKCIELGLIPSNYVSTLEDLFDFYFEIKFKTWRKRTQENWSNTKRTILKVLKPSTPIRSLTRIDADNLQHDITLLVSDRYKKRLSKGTISKHLGNLRQLFNFAVKHEFLTKNVFDEISRSGEIRDDHFEINAELSERVLEAMPDSEWRLYFAILRWAGCRKSEPLKLKVGDWEFGHEKNGEYYYGRLFIPDAKRKNKSGNYIIKYPPLFQEIENLLVEHCEMLPEGCEYLFPNIRQLSEGGIHERFTSFLKRKGITVWSSLFNNIRSTRSTEISREYGSVLESRWIGHSEATFKMSYDFDIESDYKVRDTNVTQQSGAGDCTANLVEKVIVEKKRILPDAALCIEYKDQAVPPKGFEPLFLIGRTSVLGR